VLLRKTFSITFSDSLGKEAIDGRLLLIIASSDKTEPRFQVNDEVKTAQIFGRDVDAMRPGQQM